jgi:hypothetical protein
MNNILIIFWNILFLYILLETEAIYKWSKLFKLKFMKYNEFEEKIDIYGEYKFFLAARYPNFLVSLLTCQECLAVWINIIQFIIIPEVLGGWWYFGVNCVFTITGISYFKYLLKKFYE